MSEAYGNQFYVMLRSLRETKQKQRRWGMDWSQAGVAKRLGVSRIAYIKWENGQAVPSRKHLKKIAAIFYLDENEETKLFRAAAQVPPDINNVPFPPNSFFTGRKFYLNQLYHHFQESSSVVPTQPVVISGLAGIGKTQLALAYAYRYYQKLYRAVLWVNADSTILQRSYASLAEADVLDLPERDEKELYRRIQAVKQWLHDHTNWLLILDNADDLELARSFFPECKHGHILLTSRSQFAGSIGARQVNMDVMTPAEGLRFLLRRTDDLKGKTKLDSIAADILEPASQLVALLGGHPLALDQAGAYIHETHELFTEYINLYNNQRRSFLDRYGTLEKTHPEYIQHPETVVLTFELCFRKARELRALAGDILNFCAFLQPDAIPEELFQYDDSFKVDRDTFNGGIAALLRYSLIKRNRPEQTLSFHRLVQVVLIDNMPHNLQKQWGERVVRAVNAAFPEPVYKEWARCKRLLPHVAMCSIWMVDNLTPALEAAELFYKAGIYIRAQEQNLAAIAPLAQASMLYKQGYGEDHPDTASAIGELAVTCVNEGMYEQAEPLLLQANSILVKQLGAEHPDTARSLQYLAYLYHFQAKDEQAEVLYQQALRILIKHLGAEHPSMAKLYYGLSVLLHTQGKHEQAENLYQYALSIQEQQLGTSHPSIQVTKLHHENFLVSLGNNPETVALEANDE